MKSVLILVMSLILVGTAFAAPDADLVPTIEGDATVAWGWDIDNGITGFYNEAHAVLTMPLVKHGATSKGGSKYYGSIELKDFDLGIIDQLGYENPDLTDNMDEYFDDPGEKEDTNFAVIAKLVLDKVEIAVHSAPDQGFNHIEFLSFKNYGGVLGGETQTEVEYDPADTFGTSIKLTGDLSFGLMANSQDDWGYDADDSGADNAYMVGAFANLKFSDVITVNASLGYDIYNRSFAAGADIPVTLATLMKGLTFTPGFDFVTDGTNNIFDSGANLELKLSEANADDEYTNVTLFAYYSNVEADVHVDLTHLVLGATEARANFDMKVSFDEYLNGGLVDNVELGASFAAFDVFSYTETRAYAGYKLLLRPSDYFHLLVQYANFYVDAVDPFDPPLGNYAANELKVLFEFVDTSLANATLKAAYQTGDLITDPPEIGTFVLSCKIEF